MWFRIAQFVSDDNLPHVKADSDTLTTVLTVVFTIIGALAFFLMVLAGLRYVMSQGNPEKVTSAKNQILYSFVGLVVAASAVAIVNFVLGRTE